MVIDLSQMTVLDSNLASPRKSAKWTLVYKIQTRPNLPLGYTGHPSKKARQSARKPVGKAL